MSDADTENGGGYIRLHRSLINTWAFRNNPKVGWLWVYLLLRAQWKPTLFAIGGQEVVIQRGQLIFGRKTAAKDTGLSEQEIRTALSILVRAYAVKVTIHSTRLCSIITICNYNAYQEGARPANQPVNQPPTNLQPTSNHIQEGKEGKEGKKEEETPSSASPRNAAAPTTPTAPELGDGGSAGGDADTAAKTNHVPYATIACAWNRLTSAAGLPKVMEPGNLGKGRKRKLAARWKEELFRERYESVFAKTAGNDFLTGRNDRRWRANFDWIIENDTNYVKVLEDRYGDGAGATGGHSRPRTPPPGPRPEDGYWWEHKP